MNPTDGSRAAGERSAGSAPLAGLEWLKLAASFGIVAFHLQVPGHRIGYGGLPVFMLLTAAMAARSAHGRSWHEYRSGRLRRLVLPWLVWSALYAVLQCYLASLRGQPLWSWPQWSMLAIGTFPHLWYLPFAAVVTLAIGSRAGKPGRAAGGPWAWAVAGLLAIPLSSVCMVSGLPEPLPQWAFVLPGVLLGLAMARIPPGDPAAWRAVAGLAVAVWLVCFVTWSCGWLDLALPYAAGITATAVAWIVPTRASRATLIATRTSFGVYVLHPFVALAAGLWLQNSGAQVGPGAMLVITFGVSLVVTAVLRLTPARAIL